MKFLSDKINIFKIFVYLICVVVSFQILSCTNYHLAKAGKGYEANGLYELASKQYWEILRDDPKNTKAVIGLSRTGALVVQNYSDEIDTLFDSNKLKDALAKYNQADEYVAWAYEVGIPLKITAHHSRSNLCQTIIVRGFEFLKNLNVSTEYAKISSDYAGFFKFYKNASIADSNILWDRSYDTLCSNALTVWGDTLFKQGNFIEAKGKYAQALELVPAFKPSINAIEKLVKTIIDLQVNEIKSSYDKTDYITVVKSYENFMEMWQNNFKEYTLLFPEMTKNQYLSSKELAQKQKLEQDYSSALSLIKQKKYKSASRILSDIQVRQPNYKNSVSLLEDVNNKAIMRIGLFPFRNSSSVAGINDELTSVAYQKLYTTQNDFIKFMDRENLVELLQEQALGMSGIVDERTAVQAGKIIGLNYIVFGKVITFAKDENVQPAQSIPAYNVTYHEYYEKRTHQKYNYYTSQLETVPCQVKSVRYTGTPANVKVYYGHKTMSVKVQVQLINVETSEIISSEIITNNEADEVQFADCNGCDYNSLSQTVPYDVVGSGCDDYGIGGAIQQLANAFVMAIKPPVDIQLFTTRRMLEDDYSMSQKIINETGANIQSKIVKMVMNYSDKM